MWALFGLCEGPLTAIGRQWVDKSRSYWFAVNEGASGLSPGARPPVAIPAYWAPWPTGAGTQALGYYGTAFYHGNIDLGSGNSMPNFSFEGYGPLPYTIPKTVAGESYALPGALPIPEVYDGYGYVQELPPAGYAISGAEYVPSQAFQYTPACLGTCTEEYTLPDDNPVTVVNDDLWAGDAGVTLAGVPLTAIPLIPSPTPFIPHRRPGLLLRNHPCQLSLGTCGGTYWFQPPGCQRQPRRPGHHLLIVNTPPGATVSPSGSVSGSDLASPTTTARPSPNERTPPAPRPRPANTCVSGPLHLLRPGLRPTLVLNYTYNTLLDSNPADFLPDLLTNPDYGAGFDPAKIGDLSQFSDYCLANDFLLSPVFDEQQEAREQVADILKLLNTQVVWCEDQLKFIPMGDQVVTSAKTGVTFTPDLTPVLDLTEDDFLERRQQRPHPDHPHPPGRRL